MTGFISLCNLRFHAFHGVLPQERRVGNTPSQLLENVAYRIGRQLFKAFPDIESLEIKVAKINPPMATDGGEAAVELQLINDKTR